MKTPIQTPNAIQTIQLPYGFRADVIPAYGGAPAGIIELIDRQTDRLQVFALLAVSLPAAGEAL